MRRLHVDGNQGRGDPPLSRHTEEAEEGPGLLLSPFFYVGGFISASILAALYLILSGRLA